MNKRLYKLLFIVSIAISTLNVEAKNIYVSLKGNDTNNGKFETPFKTIARAINEAKTSNESDTIFIREGEYTQFKTLIFENTSDIILQAYKKEKVSITGGFTANKKIAKKVNNKSIKNRLNDNSKDNVYVIDLNTLNIHLTDIIKKGFGHASGPSWNELFIDKKTMMLARWPNDSMTYIKEVIKQGNIISKNITDKGESIIRYDETNPDLWNSTENIWIGGYFGEGWGDEFLPISRINKKEKTITINESSYYGFKSDNKYRRWYAANVLEELDAPTEYFLDQKNNKIYFYPPTKDFHKIQISILNNPIITIKTCKNIIIKNLSIECSRGTGINIDSSNNVIIDGCNICNLGNIGIKIHGGINSYNNIIKNSQIYQTGAGGVYINGGDKKTLKHGNNSISNCRIFKFNRYERSYRPAIEFQGVGNMAEKVEIFDAPSNAIILKGNNHCVQYANIHHVCQEIHDQGAIYYGRNPTERGHTIKYSYFHEIQSPFDVRAIYHDDGACGMTVHGCIFSNISSTPVQIGGGQDIIYTNNIFMNLPSAITIDARLKTWANKWLNQGGEYDKKFKAVNYTQPPFSDAYPEMLNYWNDDPTTPKRNVISNNIFYNVKKLIVGKREYLVWKKNWETMKNPGLKNPNNLLDGLDYRIIRRHLPDFQEIPLDRIGCNL